MAIARREPCRHANQDRGACMDCGRVWPDPRPKALSRAEQERERTMLLVSMLKQQDADAEELFARYRRTIGDALALAAVDRVAARALERAMDQLVGFDERCKHGDVEGAVTALRAWIGRL